LRTDSKKELAYDHGRAPKKDNCGEEETRANITNKNSGWGLKDSVRNEEDQGHYGVGVVFGIHV
jgi:hypothetical protein